jgi:small subunit ribosomal protein S2
VVAVLDSNSDPEGISYPIPGNDDASRAINLYCDLMVGAVLDGLQAEMAASGTDMGAFEAPPEEPEAAEEAPAPQAPAEEPSVEAALEAAGVAQEAAEPAAEQPADDSTAAPSTQDEPRDTAAAG